MSVSLLLRSLAWRGRSLAGGGRSLAGGGRSLASGGRRSRSARSGSHRAFLAFDRNRAFLAFHSSGRDRRLFDVGGGRGNRRDREIALADHRLDAFGKREGGNVERVADVQAR